MSFIVYVSFCNFLQNARNFSSNVFSNYVCFIEILQKTRNQKNCPFIFTCVLMSLTKKHVFLTRSSLFSFNDVWGRYGGVPRQRGQWKTAGLKRGAGAPLNPKTWNLAPKTSLSYCIKLPFSLLYLIRIQTLGEVVFNPRFTLASRFEYQSFAGWILFPYSTAAGV